MRRGLTGRYEAGTVTGSGPFQAFVPDPLPLSPPLDLTGTVRQSLDADAVRTTAMGPMELLNRDV